MWYCSSSATCPAPTSVPTTLGVWRMVHQALGDDAARVRFVFVTVDPARDTPERMQEHLAIFNPDFIGLTGTDEELERVYDAYDVVHERVEAPDSALGYLVNHTASDFAIDTKRKPALAARLRVYSRGNHPRRVVVVAVACAPAPSAFLTIVAIRLEYLCTRFWRRKDYDPLMRMQHVNCTDIPDAIRLGCRTMSRVFNADDHDIPFFGSRVRPDACFEFSWAHSEAHVPGRHLNALLTAEDVLGVDLDETVISHHADAAFFSYSGPVAFPLNRDEAGGRLIHFVPHNLREGLHALYALARYRASEPARDLAIACIDAMRAYWDEQDGWDAKRLGVLGLASGESTFITGIARAIGPLVKLFRSIGYGPALDLAIQLANKAAKEYFLIAGEFDVEWFGAHSHSITCVMSSLAQLADLTRDAPLMGRVKAFYDNGLWKLRDELGWAIENAGAEANPDRGEANCTGDIIETALILGSWGFVDAYADVERMLRGHLLPAQLRDTSFIADPPNPDGLDSLRNVADRHLGAFGFPAPYGHQPLEFERVSFNMDIVGGAVASLCEAYRSIVTRDEAGLRINLLFDYESDAIAVKSPYTHPTLEITVRQPGPLFVRIPPWVDGQSIVLQGIESAPRTSNGHIFFPTPPVHQPISIVFPLRHQEIVLSHRTRDIRVRLRGDEVVAMDDFDADLTYFEPFEQ